MRHPLSDEYRTGRERLLALGRTLSPADGAIVSTACPAWTVKDLYAHLAGISTDILSGNTEDAATAAWADGHVADRVERELAEVLDEWETAGAEVSSIVEQAGDAFPPQLFIDQWTHEWDIRGALGERAAATPDTGVFDHYRDWLADAMTARAEAAGIDRLTVAVGDAAFDLGTGSALGTLELPPFEFARISMGRRSRAQLDALDWPMAERHGHIDVLVLWSVAETDVVDPVS